MAKKILSLCFGWETIGTLVKLIMEVSGDFGIAHLEIEVCHLFKISPIQFLKWQYGMTMIMAQIMKVSPISLKMRQEKFSLLLGKSYLWIRPKGVYSKASYYDVDIFLMDNRTWRSSDDMISYIDENQIPIKMFGNEQLNWLKNALLNSHATFKIIATGSPMLNRMNKYDCFVNYPIEHQELLRFLELHNIKGVLFITGDRHHNEIIEEKELINTVFMISL